MMTIVFIEIKVIIKLNLTNKITFSIVPLNKIAFT